MHSIILKKITSKKDIIKIFEELGLDKELEFELKIFEMLTGDLKLNPSNKEIILNLYDRLKWQSGVIKDILVAELDDYVAISVSYKDLL